MSSANSNHIFVNQQPNQNQNSSNTNNNSVNNHVVATTSNGNTNNNNSNATVNNNNNNNTNAINKEVASQSAAQIAAHNSAILNSTNHVAVSSASATGSLHSALGTAVYSEANMGVSELGVKKDDNKHIVNGPSSGMSAMSMSSPLAASSMSGAVSYSNPYSYASYPPTVAASPAMYASPAAIAKEVAQKNYANALKMAAASNALTGKPLSALTYTQVPFNKPALLPQPPYPASPQLTSPRHALAAPVSSARLTHSPSPVSAAMRPRTQLISGMSRGGAQMFAQNPYAHFLRPQLQNAAAASMGHNSYAQAVAAAANQQLMNQGYFYPGLTSGYHAHMAALSASVATSMPSAVAPTMSSTMSGIPQLPTMQSVPQAATPGSAVVLNPYKKMKTS